MIKNLINLLFPEICDGCECLLMTNEEIICSKCRHDLPLTNHYAVKENETYKKFYGKLPIEHASSIVYFHKKGIIQMLIHKLKYKGKQEIGTFFGNLYGQKLAEIHLAEKFDAIIPVPLHNKRLKERGYNQITLFGQSMAKQIEIPFNEQLLERKSYSKTQTKKSLLNRNDLKTTIFEAQFTEKDYDKHYLLIDDVITSGATLEACGKAILQIPNAKLSIVTIAYAHS